MKKTIISLSLLAITIHTHAQVNIAAFQDGHNTAGATHYLPTYFGDRFQTVQISIGSTYAGIGSNFTTVRSATEYFTADKITNEMIGGTIDHLNKKDNNINGVADVTIVNAAFNFSNRSGHKTLSIGAGVNERVELNTVFNMQTLLLAYAGNQQFAGQTINITPRFNGVAFTEYYIGAAYNLRPQNSDMVIKPAIRLSYLSGQANVSMPGSNSINMYTDPNGRFLDFGLNYSINTSSSNDSATFGGNSFNINGKTFEPGAGSGLGMDLGLRISPKPGMLFNIGVKDIGSIRFKKNTTNMFNFSHYTYEGQDIAFNEGQALNLDSIGNVAQPNYSHNDYTVKLPTKLIINGAMGFGKGDSKAGIWYRHQLVLTYIQGFDNYLSSTKSPYVALGYTRSFNNILNLGLNAGVGGVSGSTLGVLASLKLGFFNIGVSSNNIIPLIDASSGKATDAALILVATF